MVVGSNAPVIVTSVPPNEEPNGGETPVTSGVSSAAYTYDQLLAYMLLTDESVSAGP